MKIQFDVDLAECFRQGVNCPTPVVALEVDPATLSPEDRGLIADRLSGFDVLATHKPKGKRVQQPGVRLKAKLPTLDALLDAAREDEAGQNDFWTKWANAKIKDPFSPEAFARFAAERSMFVGSACLLRR